MNKKYLLLALCAGLLVVLVLLFWPGKIPADKVFDKRFRRTFRFVSEPMLVKVADSNDDTAIVWYNADHGPWPVEMEKIDDDTWRVTLKRRPPK